ncbi:MAG: polyhydroxyalkanoic acid system family protein [Arenicella sp.]|nr:polyhydroxyalkanoic acid system family protein [Arenicella sp.]
MRRINICKQHDLDEDDCRTVAEDLLDQLVDHFGGYVEPDGDHYCYIHGTGIKAKVLPGEGELTINVTMSLLTGALAPRLEQEIHRVLEEQIG